MASKTDQAEGADERDAATLQLVFACAETGVPLPEGEELEAALDEIVLAEDKS